MTQTRIGANMNLWNWIKSLFGRLAPSELALTAAEQCAYRSELNRCVLKVGHGGAHVFGTGPADVREATYWKVEGTATGRLPEPPTVLQNVPLRTETARALKLKYQGTTERRFTSASNLAPEPVREPEPDLFDTVVSVGTEIAVERAIESLFDSDSSSSPDTSSPSDDYNGGGGEFGGGGASGDW